MAKVLFYTETELRQALSRPMKSLVETDNLGQVVIYTGVYLWKDGTYRDEKESE